MIASSIVNISSVNESNFPEYVSYAAAAALIWNHQSTETADRRQFRLVTVVQGLYPPTPINSGSTVQEGHLAGKAATSNTHTPLGTEGEMDVWHGSKLSKAKSAKLVKGWYFDKGAKHTTSHDIEPSWGHDGDHEASHDVEHI